MEIFYIFIFVTAVVFTLFGYGVGKSRANKEIVTVAISTTIDSLIRDGYLRTRGTGDDMEILKIADDQAD